MTAFWEALDAMPAHAFYGWCGVVLVVLAVASHFEEWRA